MKNLFFKGRKNKAFPFNKEKAYSYTRQGVIAGGGFYLYFNPTDIVEYYSYVKYAPEFECGMRDKGADIYFVGLRKGRVEVRAVYEYPTCEPEEFSFTLNVADDLTVTRIN